MRWTHPKGVFSNLLTLSDSTYTSTNYLNSYGPWYGSTPPSPTPTSQTTMASMQTAWAWMTRSTGDGVGKVVVHLLPHLQRLSNGQLNSRLTMLVLRLTKAEISGRLPTVRSWKSCGSLRQANTHPP